MTLQTSLFDTCIATVRIPDTREMARKKVALTKKSLHIRLLRDFMTREFGIDEWSIEHGLTILATRPRLTELVKANLLQKTGRSKTVQGNSQNKYRLRPEVKERIARLGVRWGLDKAIEAVLEEVNA